MMTLTFSEKSRFKSDQWRNNPRKNEEMEPKKKKLKKPSCGCDWWWKLVWCYKEQYCIGDWNVRFMNQGKFGSGQTRDGKSELKSTGMVEFNSDDHYIYYCG